MSTLKDNKKSYITDYTSNLDVKKHIKKMDITEIAKDVGFLLKKERKTIGMSTQDLSKHTKLRPEYIEKIESGDILDIIDKIYYIGYVKNIAKLLSLDADKIVKHIKSASASQDVQKDRNSKQSAYDTILKYGSIAVLTIVFLYLFLHKH